MSNTTKSTNMETLAYLTKLLRMIRTIRVLWGPYSGLSDGVKLAALAELTEAMGEGVLRHSDDYRDLCDCVADGYARRDLREVDFRGLESRIIELAKRNVSDAERSAIRALWNRNRRNRNRRVSTVAAIRNSPEVPSATELAEAKMLLDVFYHK